MIFRYCGGLVKYYKCVKINSKKKKNYIKINAKVQFIKFFNYFRSTYMKILNNK